MPGCPAAIEAREAAVAALEARQTAHLRSQAHLEGCRTRLASFNALENEVLAATITSLRTDGTSAELSADLRAKLAEREVARTELAGAEGALATFREEHRVATHVLEAARDKERAVLHELLMLARDALKPELWKLEARAAALRQAYQRPDGEWPWKAVMQALKLDPLGADLSVTVPDQPVEEPPPAVVVVARQTIRRARPVNAPPDFDDRPIPLEEFVQRRAAELRGERVHPQLAEDRAREAARRPLER